MMRFLIPERSLSAVLEILFGHDGVLLQSLTTEGCAELAALLQGVGKPHWPQVERSAAKLLGAEEPEVKVVFRDDMLLIVVSQRLTFSCARNETGFEGQILFPRLAEKLTHAGCTLDVPAAV